MNKTKRNIIIIVAVAVAVIGIVLAIVLPLTLNRSNATYTVTFDSNGGTEVESIVNVTHGSTIAEPQAPIKAGYAFEGWFKDPQLNRQWAFATDTVKSDITLYAKWTYNATNGLLMILNGNEYTVAGIGTVENATDIVIPSTYEGLPVTAIGARAFKDLASLKTVFIPDSVKAIKGGVDSGAFRGCVNLMSVRLPKDITSIEAETFYDCAKLKDIEIPSDLVSIGDHAFSGCKSLTAVALPASLQSLGENAFSNCINIESLSVDTRNMYFYSRADGVDFNCIIAISPNGQSVNKVVAGCKNSVIPTSSSSRPATVIGQGAFYGCSSLESILIPYGVTEIEESAFESCSGLGGITIPSSVTTIGERAFSGCHILKYVTFGKINEQQESDLGNYNIKYIGREAFSYCYDLNSFHLRDSLTYIGAGVFYRDYDGWSMDIDSELTVNNLRNIIASVEAGEENYYTYQLTVKCFDTGNEGVQISGLA